MSVTAATISEKLSALDVLSGDLARDFDEAAMKAVAGDQSAGQKAAEINQRIERLAIDKRILDRAKVRAETAEALAAAQAEASRRKEHVRQARATAKALIDIADKVDALVDDLMPALTALSDAEGKIRSHLSSAKQPVDVGIVGRRGLALFVQDRIATIMTGRIYDKTERRTGHWARVGWAELLDEGENV